MRKARVLFIVAVLFVLTSLYRHGLPQFSGQVSGSDEPFATAFAQQQSGIHVQGGGTVVRLLADDSRGDRHQRFIVRLGSGQTLLVAHNIDLASRIANLRTGDAVAFSGQYEWNPDGGVIHWTHLDPNGRHAAGWIRHDGRTYQ
jgi:hypothetical protein